MTGFSLSADNAVDYLAARDVIPDADGADVETLGGGVSNVVLRVRTGGDCLVLKQPLANLAVEDDWPADLERVHNEAAAARTYGDVIDDAGLDGVRVPAVLFESRSDHVIAVTCAPASATTWKRELLEGDVDPGVAAALGRFLGASHRETADDPTVEAAFDHDRPFDQLRLDPYHRAVAERHPDVAGAVESELDRLSSVRRTLVHGDFSPKNVLVDRRSTPRRLWVLDFEVAHWGDPAFDTAFMLNHLFIKSVYRAEAQDAYLAAAREFWDAYAEQVDWVVEYDTVRELAVLMLARVDGKSPVEYVRKPSTKQALRSAAKRALREDVKTLSAYAALLEEVARA